MFAQVTLSGRKVLVTGADGFIGSHLTERLVSEGAAVRAFCFYHPQGSWGWLDQAPAEVRAALDVRLGDIRDARFVGEACRDVEIVFHLAALIAIPFSYVAPESFVQTNVQGTLNLLEGVRNHGVARFVHTSTSEVYGTPTELPIRETHPQSAQSPYAATKIAADQLALAYHRSFDVPVTILRPFNTYGPRQSARAVIPTILTQLIAGREEIELGRLDPRRDMTFVSDTVDGFVRAATGPGIDGRTIQLGTGRAPSIQEIFDVALAVTGARARVRVDPRRLRPDPSEVMVLESAPDQARELLGWRPEVSLEDGLRRTADWLRSHMDRYRPDLLHV
jgi:NAD dependent epimerase/dehydratase